MEREVVRQEQRTLPWPFAPHSPRRLVSSQFSHSLSVGSSPTRAPLRAATVAPGGHRDLGPRSPLMERCRAKRTSNQEGLLARGSLYSRHMDVGAAELLHRRLTGLDAAWTVNPPRHADTHPSRSSSAPLSLPFLSEKDDVRRRTAVGGVHVSRRPLGDFTKFRLDGDGEPDVWSWTVGDGRFTAKWVKHKQECRGTCPW